MLRSAGLRTALALALCADVAPARLAATELADRLAAETARLAATLERLESAELPEMVREMPGRQRAALEAVHRAGAPELAIYRLRGPFVALGALELLAAHREVATDLAGFEALWREHAARHAASVPGTSDAPAIVRALHQSGRNRAEKLYRAARPYAKASSPLAGLYYLGEAEGERTFADFVLATSAAWPRAARHEPEPSVAVLGATIDSIERETVAAFAGDPSSPAMIPVSARLKEARELYERSSLDAAALATLESRLALSRRLAEARAAGTPAPPSPRAAAVPAQPLVTDGSLRTLLLALAAEPGAPDGTAAIVVDELLPLHASLYGSAP